MKSPLSYGVAWGPTRQEQLIGHARAYLGPTINSLVGSDFESQFWYEPGVGCIPLVSVSEEAIPFVNGTSSWVEVDSSDVAGTAGVCRPASAVMQWLHHPRTTLWEATWFGGMRTDVDTQAVLTFDLRDQGEGISPDLRIGLVGSGAGGATKFSAQAFDNTGTLIYNHDTGVAFDKNNHLWRMRCDLTNFLFFIDELQVGSTPVASLGTGVLVCPEIIAFNGTTAAHRIVVADYMYLAAPGVV